MLNEIISTYLTLNVVILMTIYQWCYMTSYDTVCSTNEITLSTILNCTVHLTCTPHALTTEACLCLGLSLPWEWLLHTGTPIWICRFLPLSNITRATEERLNNVLPMYCRKYWQSLDLAVWPQTKLRKILNLVVAPCSVLHHHEHCVCIYQGALPLICLRYLNKAVSL